jgi:hypothetical protein
MPMALVTWFKNFLDYYVAFYWREYFRIRGM